ncbi:ParM/StbA family protein [Clostridioides difficile]|uniref:ParM/StbA family protein n=1 Tax=Clostridioides difficile TaxID=1496 RepID=UPI00202E9FDF|nr:ParM/StbA family protein [Clostridioides difficile]MCM0739865.1 ParM/StbA family protein [Clostridioides difficile]HBF2930744.1 ParM/StbA family protein [Clostridioides difficile]HBF2935729.1 ParM/StbA family protein [Clostridioides difficile]HBZ0282924.1 ParM/StbA family protein [Clostridioides difficile]
MNEKIANKIIVVDPGKNAVKVVVFSNTYELLTHYMFPSKTQIRRTFSDIDGSSDFQFRTEFEGSKYLIGEGVQSSYNFETTKNNIHHQLCVYTAIAKEVHSKNENVYVVVGYPSSDFSNEIQREKYVDLIKSNEKIDIILNGSDKSFNISGFKVFPEGMALVPRLKFPKRKVRVIDIGGQNLNHRLYDEKGNTLESFSLDEAGINHLEEHLRTTLRKNINADMVDIDSINTLEAIESQKIDAISDDMINGYDSVASFIENTVLDFIDNKILNQLSSKNVFLYKRSHLIIFTGGGSIALKKYLEELLPNNSGNLYFSETATWDNCASYLIKDLTQKFKDSKISKIEFANYTKKIIKAFNDLIIDITPSTEENLTEDEELINRKRKTVKQK